MRKLIRSLSIAAFTALPALLHLKPIYPANAENLVFATTSYPPFSIHNNLEIGNAGFINEMVHEAFKRHGHEITYQFLPAQRAKKLAKSGQVTGNFQSVKTEENRKLFLYSRPFSHMSASYFTLGDYEGPRLQNMEDCRGIRVVTTLGTPLESMLIQLRVPHFTVRSEEFGLKLLLGKRVDAYLAYTLPTEWIYQHLEMGSGLTELKAEEVALYPFYLAIHKNVKNGEALIDQFNASISDMKRDGSYHNIMMSYVNYLKP